MTKIIHIIPHDVAKALGMNRFFTGKPCKRGRITERWVNSRVCVGCDQIRRDRDKLKRLEYHRRYREQRREELLKASKEYYQENRERVLEYWRCHYYSNRSRVIRRSRSWKKNNKDRHRAYSRQWVENNPERRKQYVKENKDLFRAANSKRRTATKRGAGNHEVASWARSQNKVCFYCSSDCTDNYHIDHYIPLSKGGEHEIYNLRIACASCNLKKHAKMPDEFMADL